jgi:hypothetical protein
MSARARLILAGALVFFCVAGCARPYSGPKTLAAIGAGLVLVGSAAWIAGERGNPRSLVGPGMATTAIGAGLIIGAGGWMAGAIRCQGDPDCPTGEECREQPAPPGGIPYKQCVRR